MKENPVEQADRTSRRQGARAGEDTEPLRSADNGWEIGAIRGAAPQRSKPNCGIPICKCGEPKQMQGRKSRYWICVSCNRARLKARAHTGRGEQLVSVAGARERLARLLDTRWHEVAPRLADLLDRSEAFGRVLS